jgi:hypothetical protein
MGMWWRRGGGSFLGRCLMQNRVELVDGGDVWMMESLCY